jgi:hypothetical protein
MRTEVYFKRVPRGIETAGIEVAKTLNEGASNELSRWGNKVVPLLSSLAMKDRVQQEELSAVERLFAPYHFRIYPRGVIRGQWQMPLHPVDRGPKGGFAFIVWELATSGAVIRFRRCSKCKSWFFATREKQQFCSTDCRQEVTRSSPEYIEAQRKRVLAYYYKQHPEAKKRQEAKRKRGRK